MYYYWRYLISLSLLGLVFLSSSVDAGPRVKTLDNPIVMRFSSFSTSLALLDDMTNDGIPEYLVGAYDQPYAPEGKTGSAIGGGVGPSPEPTPTIKAVPLSLMARPPNCST